MKNVRITTIFCQAVIALVSIFALQQCANPVSPTGGPRDVAPPVLVHASPPMQSVNFNAEKIKLTFDEYVEFKDLTKQLIVSPPMEKKPEFRIKQKSIEILFHEELKPNTTYNLFFGNAIVDITEGNPLSNFQYVFATGNVLDSMEFRGVVKDAYNFDPIENVSVMLYLDNNDSIPFDSLPYFVRPYFMSRTNDEGQFQFFNLPDKDFKIFALEDGNSNLLFDQQSERIAFVDSLIHPYYVPVIIAADSTVESDSIVLADTPVQADSVIHSDSLNKDMAKAAFVVPEPLRLFLFQEADSVQRLMKAGLAGKQHVIFVFKHAVKQPEFKVLNMDLPDDWMISETHVMRDTLSWWLREIPSDSLEVIVSDQGEVLDTVQLALVKPSKKKKPEKEIKSKALKVNFQKSLQFDKSLMLSFDYPVIRYNPDSILLVEGEDSVYSYLQFTDSLPHQAGLNFPWKEKTTYKLEIPDSVFTDILGQSNDTLRKSYTAPSFADFGNMIIHLKIENPQNTYIFQLLMADKVLKEFTLKAGKDIHLNYLKPETYRLRIIFDSNNNGRWDAGNYLHAIYPEEVIFYPSEITVRANWDVEEEWAL